jgi:outer membrane biosynthesis protein TonB
MKDSNSPQAPVQLSNTEGSGLLDVKQMAEALKSSSDAKKRNMIDMSLPMAPAAPLAGALLLPLPRQRSPLGLVGIIMGGTAAATAVILGTLFAAGVFEKKAPPAPLVVAATPPPVVVAPPVAETQPVVETPVVDPKKTSKTGTKKTNTKATNTNTNTTVTSPPPPPKKKTHKDELEELLGK